jgi:hypothetical protein
MAKSKSEPAKESETPSTEPNPGHDRELRRNPDAPARRVTPMIEESDLDDVRTGPDK